MNTDTADDGTEALVEALRTALDDKKAVQLVTLDVRGSCAFADYFIIADGRNGRHLKALAEAVVEVGHRFGLPAPIEGLDAMEWLVIDLLDVVVHLFLPETREYFQLERLWQAPPERPACASG
ncbi:MAG: ribosome silencing factor [Zetaproteobacteria bacterium]|nr:MAG: ribosome silencing factor [Zetaproteobacteria bacterium]